MNERQPVLVVVLGNQWAGDDALGPAVAAEMTQRCMPGIEVIDLATAPAGLVGQLVGREAVLIVDAARFAPGGRAPGEVVEMDWSDPARPALLSKRTVSTHGWSITDELQLAEALGTLPSRVRILAVAIDEAVVGRPMSQQVADAVGRVAGRIAHLR